MAMAVKESTEATTTRMSLDRLAVGSLVGAVFVLGALGVVFPGIGTLWESSVDPLLANKFVAAALLLVVRLAAVVGFVVLGRMLIGTHAPAGLRAGITVAIAGLIGIAIVAQLGGMFLAAAWPAVPPTVGLGITAGLALALMLAGVRAYFRPKFQKWLVQFEEQGWFNAVSYKRNQGVRVRRGTMVGILLLAASGLYTLLSHKTLEHAVLPHLYYVVPFTGGWALQVLPDIRFTVPILLAAASLWLAWRAVNFPAFADFLIATEAELNKVSWPTLKRLRQDTIVVLTTMILMTVFLLVVDVIWGWGLTQVGVLQQSDKTTTESSKKEVDW